MAILVSDGILSACSAMRGLLAALAIAFCSGIAHAQNACTDHQQCLTDALSRQYDRYLQKIENAWSKRKQAISLLERARASNQPELVSRAESLLAAANRDWQYAQRMGEVLGTAELAHSLAERARRDRDAYDKSRAALEHATDLFRHLLRVDQTGSGADRARIMADIESYQGESAALARQFQFDLMLAAGAATIAGVYDKLAAIKGLQEPEMRAAVRAARDYLDRLKTAPVAIKATDQLKDRQILRAAATVVVGGVAFAATHAERYVRRPSFRARDVKAAEAWAPTAGRILFWANFAAPTLDLVLIAQGERQLDDALARLGKLEQSEASWRDYLTSLGDDIKEAKAKSTRSDLLVDKQAKIRQLMKHIQAEDSR